ncbi:hypothetical protein Tco_0471214 [Tanacetum coccineum]
MLKLLCYGSTFSPTPPIPPSMAIDVSLAAEVSSEANQHMFQTTHSNATQPTKTEDLHEDLEYEKRNSTSINTSKNAASRSMAPCLPPIVVSERKRRGRPKKNIVSGNLLSNILMSPDLIDVPVQMLESDTSKNSPKVVVADLKQPHDKSRRPDVIFLMEMKNKQQKLERLCRSLHFASSYDVDPVGRQAVMCFLSLRL